MSDTSTKAVLLKDIAYVKDGEPRMAYKDSIVTVDVTKGLVLVNEDHVDVFEDEYRILNN